MLRRVDKTHMPVKYEAKTFMEAEFGDMDKEVVEEKDKWILELRDAVELKRGYHASYKNF